MTTLVRVPSLVLFPILLLVSACGLVHYTPIDMLDPRPARDPALRASTVEAELRIGREWLEVLVHNPGPAPVRIDWGRANFTEPTGAAHLLLSSARLNQLYRYWFMRQSSPHNAYGTFGRPSLARDAAWVQHILPLVLEHETSEVSVVLQAGESIVEVLYPGEHVRVGDRGELLLGSLFCGRDAGGENRQPFTVRIPVQRQNQWEMVTLVARLH